MRVPARRSPSPRGRSSHAPRFLLLSLLLIARPALALTGDPDGGTAPAAAPAAVPAAVPAAGSADGGGVDGGLADGGLAVDGGPLAQAKADAEKARLAVVGALRPTQPGTCVTSQCHVGFKEDPKHKEMGLGCPKCHFNIDAGQPHKDKLDETPPEVMCAQGGCHGAITAKQRAGPHKDSTCDGCHGEVHEGFKKADYSTCRSCHKEEVTAFVASVHGTARKAVACADCHGNSHSPIPKTDPLSPVSKILQVGTCSECHDSEYIRAFRTSVHGEGLLKSGLSVAPTCSDCHGAHDIADVKDPASKLSRANVVGTCGKCHTFIVTRWERSSHGIKWAAEQAVPTTGRDSGVWPDGLTTPEGKPRKAPVCTTCHLGHRTYDPRVYQNNLRMSDICGECHKSQSASYRDSFHGKATRLNLGVAATCADCHTPHGMLPTQDPASSVNPANLDKTCGDCHKEVNAGFLSFDPHLDPKDPKGNPLVHWIWLFMTLLLVGVLGFYAVHALLWLQRSLVAILRHEFHHPPKKSEVWVRRFQPLHIGLHVTIILTFLTLAATGLPLKFSGSPWAHYIEAIFGGLGSARWFHRIAGILTFGYAGVYLGYLIREIGIKRRFELLWGWQSMVPNLKDLTDLIDNIRWFIYQGPPPKLDRWTYWEKFDFFAVFWGIPVIGLSGLALWEPLWVTAFLPGWVINIAYLVHSDEALLATGFIFYFHFFHTHLRPESFPLDTVVFLGGMPLERFREERPAEYKHLVDAGELEKHFMPPPTERTTRRALRFAVAALVVGLILGTFLMVVGFAALFR